MSHRFDELVRSCAISSLLIVSVCLGGCDKSKKVDTNPANAGANAAEQSDEPLSGDDSDKYGSYSYGMLPSDIPDEFQDVLDQFATEVRDVQLDFERVLAGLRESNEWLDRSLDEPIETAFLTDAGELPGPTTKEIHAPLQAMFDAFADDFETNAQRSDDEKKLAVEQFQAVIMQAYYGDEPNYEILTEISDRYEAGDIDPIMILPLLEYDALRDDLRRSCMRQLGESLESRRCSSITKLLMVCAAAENSNYLSFADRILCTHAAIDSVEDVLREFKSVGSPLDYIVHNAGAALNPAGNIEYVKTVLALDRDLVPDHLRHFLIAKIHGKVAARARGGDFIDTVSPQDLQRFSSSSYHEAAHLLKSWTLAPTHAASTKALFANELRSSSTPISPYQWYRIALTTQSDSRATTRLMAQTFQPRWGGSMEELADYTNKIIELAKKPDTRLLWDIPLEMYLWDESWCVNVARETDFDESILSLLDSLEQTHGDEPDRRITRQFAKPIVRVLWDAGELDRLNEFADRYGSVLDGESWYSYLIPAHLVTQVMMARRALPNDAWDVLQEELMVGSEVFDAERMTRIDDAMNKIREAVEKHQAANVTNESDSDDADEPSDGVDTEDEVQDEQWPTMALERFERLYETVNKFHGGDTVDLIGSEMGCWSCTSGGVTFNEDSIDITTKCWDKGLFFFQPLRFELPLVIELDVTQSTCDADPYGIALFAGPVAQNSTGSRFSGRSLRYSPGYPMIMQDRLPPERLKGHYYHEERLLPVPKWATLKIEIEESGTRSYVNDKLITETDYKNNTGGYLHFGRWAGDTFTGVPDKSATYKLTSLRVKPYDPQADNRTAEAKAVETSRQWIAKNLDLADRKLEDYHFTVYRNADQEGSAFLYVQFAHMKNMAKIIHPQGIEMIKGGFPDYFSIDVKHDGTEVLSHYAASE